MWVIHDLLGYGLTAHCQVRGYNSCPICGDRLNGRYSKALKKCVFTDCRRFLEPEHPFRKESSILQYEQELREPPQELSREEWIEQSKGNNKVIKKESISFKLDYWKDLLIRHLVDGMHIEKNVCHNIMMLLLGENDSRAVREDLQECNIRRELWLRDIKQAPTTANPTRIEAFQPSAPWILDDVEKSRFIDRVRSLKLPSNFSANIHNYFGTDNKLQHLKSHDYHILMQHVIPVALRGLLQPGPRRAILRLCRVFQRVTAPVLNPAEFPMLMRDASETLCLLVKELPPTNFTISFHQVYHLVKETTLCGVIHTRWMYPVERYFKVLKSFVKNLARPEGSISESYWLYTNIGFLLQYIPQLPCTINRKILGVDLENETVNPIRFQQRGSKKIILSNGTRKHVINYMLSNSKMVAPYHK